MSRSTSIHMSLAITNRSLSTLAVSFHHVVMSLKTLNEKLVASSDMFRCDELLFIGIKPTGVLQLQ